MKYITFENGDKSSLFAHEHVTCEMREDGVILILSREPTKSVSARWDRIGAWGAPIGDIPGWVAITENSRATRLAAAGFALMGYSILGVEPKEGEWGHVNILHSDGVTTNPDSIRGNVRKRTNTLGSKGKGEHGAGRFGARVGGVDVKAMREAIAARRFDRMC